MTHISHARSQDLWFTCLAHQVILCGIKEFYPLIGGNYHEQINATASPKFVSLGPAVKSAASVHDPLLYL